MSTPASTPKRVRRISRSHVSEALITQPLHRLGLAGALVVLGVTAAFGGLRPESPTIAASLTTGSPVAADPFTITVEKVVSVRSLPSIYLTRKSDRWLVVVAQVRNTSASTVFGAVELRAAIGVSGVPGLLSRADPSTHLVPSDSRNIIDDGSNLDQVQPGLTYDVAYLWEQSGAAQPPTSVAVSVEGLSWTRSSIDQTYEWADPHVVAHGDVDVEQKAT